MFIIAKVKSGLFKNVWNDYISNDYSKYKITLLGEYYERSW